MSSFRLGLAFLTRIPGPHATLDDRALGRATIGWPVAGLLTGLFQVVVLTCGSFLVHPAVGAALAVAAGMWFTRGLHVDGLADCLDGLLANGDRERRLAVMHDPHVGALGAAGVALWMCVRVAAVVACIDAGRAVEGLVVAAIVSRTPLAAELRWGTPAQERGLFWMFHRVLTTPQVLAGIAVAIALLSAIAAFSPVVLMPMGVGIAAALLLTISWHRTWIARIGGLNGDVLGAAVELREVCVLCALGSPLLPAA